MNPRVIDPVGEVEEDDPRQLLPQDAPAPRPFRRGRGLAPLLPGLIVMAQGELQGGGRLLLVRPRALQGMGQVGGRPRLVQREEQRADRDGREGRDRRGASDGREGHRPQAGGNGQGTVALRPQPEASSLPTGRAVIGSPASQRRRSAASAPAAW